MNTPSQKRIGIASDHAGYELKTYIAGQLRDAGYDVDDFGNDHMEPGDDYPDYVVPLAMAVVNGDVWRGIAICGSGVGACVAANKVRGIRACLVTDTFSAHQGVEDDDMNLICLGGRITGPSLAWELTFTFLRATFIGGERHIRRLDKVKAVEASRE